MRFTRSTHSYLQHPAAPCEVITATVYCVTHRAMVNDLNVPTDLQSLRLDHPPSSRACAAGSLK